MNGIKVVDTQNVSKAEWLSLRTQGIGGSDAAAVLGVNPWKSPLNLYYEKVDPVEKLPTLAMELGNYLESFIRSKTETWLRQHDGVDVVVRPDSNMYRHPQHEMMTANLDGIIDHPERGPSGLEIKTANEFMRAAWDADEIPDVCYIQVQHYMAVTGLAHFYVAYLIGNREFGVVDVPRNDEFIPKLVQAEAEFWNNHVIPRIPPDPMGLPSDTETLKTIYSRGNGQAINLSNMEEHYSYYKQLKEQEKKILLELNKIKQAFMAAMGEAETALVGQGKITWRTVERKGYTVAPGSSRQLRVL